MLPVKWRWVLKSLVILEQGCTPTSSCIGDVMLRDDKVNQLGLGTESTQTHGCLTAETKTSLASVGAVLPLVTEHPMCGKPPEPTEGIDGTV